MRLELPKALINSLKGLPGFDEEVFVKLHESGEQVTSVRMNDEKLTEQLLIENCQLSIVSWCPFGYYLSYRPSFTFDPLFHAGVYYVQEASSMFLWEILKQTIGANTDGKRVLDLCAAPGGKSTLLASYFKNGLIISNDVIKSRANILVENMTKWGSENVVVTNNDPKDFAKLENYFDVIVIDAPCSGSGLFRKDNEAISEWSEDNVKLCSLRQQRITADIFPSLKKDGILIYSTCSYSKEEDEDNCQFIIDSCQLSPISLSLKKEWNIIESSIKSNSVGYRFFPDKIKGEGFFIAAFKKNDGEDFYSPSNSSSLLVPSKSETEIVKEWINFSNDISLFKQKQKIIAINKRWKDDIALLQKNLYIRKAAVALGSVKGKDFVPEHELALSNLINNSIQKIELSKEQAIQYLKKREIVIETEIKGWVLATYLDKNLGWMKILHNRINNYYPTEWRILKD